MDAWRSFRRKHFQRKKADITPTINNPFKNKDLGEVDRESKAFAEKIDKDDPKLLELFEIAGRIAFNPPGWRDDILPRLDKRQKTALLSERGKGVFSQTKTTFYTVIALWLSSIIQGWIQSTLNGANLTWSNDTGLSNATTQKSALWNQAGTNSVVFFVATGACFFSDPLQSRWLGRRGILFAAAITCLSAAVGAACVDWWTDLLACRVVLGIAMGLKASVTTIYAAEISPSHLRGTILMGWQAGDTLGIAAGFTANLIVVKSGLDWKSSWRWQTASLLLPSLVLAVLIFTVPDSPRLYLRRGHYEKAFRAMCQLRETPLQAARDLFYANAQLQVESDELLKDLDRRIEKEKRAGMEWQITRYQSRVGTLWWLQRVWRLISSPRTRRALQSAVIVMISQQFSGFNILAFYSSNFFSFDLGSSQPSSKATWLSWGIGLANFVFTIPAFWIIDHARVWLLLATYPFMIVFMLATCLTFQTAGSEIPKDQVTGLVFAFTVFYSLGQGPVAFTYSAEVFPLVYRESGMSIAVAANFMFAGLLTLLAPQAQFAGETSWAQTSPDQNQPDVHDFRHFNSTQAKMLGTFVGLEVLAFILIFLFVPETAKCTPVHKDDLNYLSLEEINSIFEQPTLHHTWYRIRHVVPQALYRLRWKLFGTKVDGQEPHKIIVLWRWPPNIGHVGHAGHEVNDGNDSKAETQEIETVRPEHGEKTASEREHAIVTEKPAHWKQDDDAIRRVDEAGSDSTQFKLKDIERGPSFRTSHFEHTFREKYRSENP